MNSQAKLRAYITLVVGSLAFAAFLLAVTSCSTIRAAERPLKAGAVGGAAAIILFPAGLFVVTAGVVISVAAMNAISENAALADGDLTGTKALKAQNAQLVETLAAVGYRADKLAKTVDALSEPKSWIDTLSMYFLRFVWFVVVVLIIRTCIFERRHLVEAWSMFKAGDWAHGVWSLVKAFFGVSHKA